MLESSKYYRFVRVDDETGRSSSYNPETVGGDIQTMLRVTFNAKKFNN